MMIKEPKTLGLEGHMEYMESVNKKKNPSNLRSAVEMIILLAALFGIPLVIIHLLG